MVELRWNPRGQMFGKAVHLFNVHLFVNTLSYIPTEFSRVARGNPPTPAPEIEKML